MLCSKVAKSPCSILGATFWKGVPVDSSSIILLLFAFPCRLEDLNRRLGEAEDVDTGRREFELEVDLMTRKIEEEKAASAMSSNMSLKSNGLNSSTKKNVSWTHEEMALLIKAVNVFPAGTAQRYLFTTTTTIHHLWFLSTTRPCRVILLC